MKMNDTEELCAKSNTLKILIIDDNQDFADVMSELIEMLGYRTFIANKGREGIAKAKEFHPDVIICDIGLPEMNGYEVAESIRNDNELKDLLLISLSGYTSQKDIERSMAAGFNQHLAKPVDINDIENILGSL
jgi:CheY-like chemotaxis protein